MAENPNLRTKALTRLSEMEMSPVNPLVRAAAKRLRAITPEGLVKRIEAAFPSKFEQRIYVVITNRIWKRAAYPETISACFQYFNDGQPLSPVDFGENGRANRVLESTAQTLLMMSRGFMSKEVAMRFVQRFGDRAEEVYNLIGDNLQSLMRKLGIRTYSREAMMGILYAIAYADSEHPEILDLDIVSVDDVERILGCVTEWQYDDDAEAIAHAQEIEEIAEEEEK